jgi:hypothetical protein
MAAGLAIGLLALFVLLAAAAYQRRHPKVLRVPRSARRILIPFTSNLDPTVLDAAIRIAHAERGVLVPAYLLVVPLQYAEDTPLRNEVAVAMPLLEAVEHAALRAGVPVDARIERGRTPTHALQRLWQVEEFDRVIVPAPMEHQPGFTAKDLAWILTHAPSETLVLKPGEHRPPLAHTA